MKKQNDAHVFWMPKWKNSRRACNGYGGHRAPSHAGVVRCQYQYCMRCAVPREDGMECERRLHFKHSLPQLRCRKHKTQHQPTTGTQTLKSKSQREKTSRNGASKLWGTIRHNSERELRKLSKVFLIFFVQSNLLLLVRRKSLSGAQRGRKSSFRLNNV